MDMLGRKGEVVEVDGRRFDVTYERRRYGSRRYSWYCWAYVDMCGESIPLGDPYPAVRWARAALADAIRAQLPAIRRAAGATWDQPGSR